jgi:acetyltransferase-like isoleucine patch superfamily enzyme
MLKIKLFIKKVIGIYKVWNNNKISKKSFIARNVQFLGVNNIEIGTNCTIGENSTFTVNDRDDKKVRLKIGKNTYIGRNNFFSVGRYVKVGTYCIFGNNCSLICSDHIFDSPLTPYASSGNSYDKRIYVGVNCWFGHGVTVIGDVKIGHGCIIGANTLITKNIPPFSMVVGNPARIIKTFNFGTNKWDKEVQFNECKYSDEQEYLKYLKLNSSDIPLAHYSASSRLGHL